MADKKLHPEHEAIVAHIATFYTVGEAEDGVEEKFGVGIVLLAERQEGDPIAALANGTAFALVYA